MGSLLKWLSPSPALMPPVAASTVYSILHDVLGTQLVERGFSKKRQVYTRDEVVVRFQTSKWGWDEQSGGEFVVNFEPVGRISRRVGDLLAPADLQKALKHAEGIFRRTPSPPGGKPDPGDFWLPYYTDEDVVYWANFLSERLSAILDRASQA